MDTGKCESCGGPNNGARLCIKCDNWETILGRMDRVGLSFETKLAVAMEAKADGYKPVDERS